MAGLKDNLRQWRDSAQIDWFSQFIKAWIPFNAWMKAERGPVYLVVVGNSDTEFRDLLHTWVREANSGFLLSSPFHLIEKRKP